MASLPDQLPRTKVTRHRRHPSPVGPAVPGRSCADHTSVPGLSDGSAPGVAAVLFPATPTECGALADALGQGWEVRDGRRVDRAAVVFLRACSTQTIAGVRTRFPDAHLVVVEAPLGGSTYVSGRVRRALEGRRGPVPGPERGRHDASHDRDAADGDAGPRAPAPPLDRLVDLGVPNDAVSTAGSHARRSRALNGPVVVAMPPVAGSRSHLGEGSRCGRRPPPGSFGVSGSPPVAVVRGS